MSVGWVHIDGDACGIITYIIIRSVPIGCCVISVTSVIGISPGTANQDVIACATVQDIVAGFAPKNVVSTSTVQFVDTAASGQDIVICVSVQHIRRGRAGQVFNTNKGISGCVTRIRYYPAQVCSNTGCGILIGDSISAFGAVQLVGTRTSYEDIILFITYKGVIMDRTYQAFYARKLIPSGVISCFLLPGDTQINEDRSWSRCIGGIIKAFTAEDDIITHTSLDNIISCLA